MRFFLSRFFLGCVAIGFAVLSAVLYLTVEHYRRGEKTIAIDGEKFREKLQKPAPAWMLEQIQSDLSVFAAEGISKQRIDAAFQGELAQKYHLVRFTIVDGRMTVALDERCLKKGHFRQILTSMRKLNELVKLPDVDFILSLMDGYNETPPGFPICPCFVFAKSKDLGNFVLMPDFKAFWGYDKLQEEILAANQKFPWQKKLDQSFWRGSTTGGFFTGKNWGQFARGKLVNLSLTYPDWIDARFTGVVQCTPEVKGLMRAKGMLSKKIGKSDHLHYKYLVDVDGNSCSFERYYWLLLSNSLVLKQITPYMQWYYRGLIPFVHFVPVKEDLSDLVDKIQWAAAHEKEAQQIAKASTQFVEENLATEDVFVYMVHLLREYSRLQN